MKRAERCDGRLPGHPEWILATRVRRSAATDATTSLRSGPNDDATGWRPSRRSTSRGGVASL